MYGLITHLHVAFKSHQSECSLVDKEAIFGDSVELPNWLKSGGGTKKVPKVYFSGWWRGALVLAAIWVPNVRNVSMHCVLCC